MIIPKPGNELSKEIHELYNNNKLRATESKIAPSIKSAARKFWNQIIVPYTNDGNSFPALMEKPPKDSLGDMFSELKFGKLVPILDLENLRERGINFGLPHYNFFTLQFGSTFVRGGQLIQKEKPNGIVVTGFFPPESDLFNRKYLTAYFANLIHYSLLDSNLFWHISQAHPMGEADPQATLIANFVDRFAREIKYSAVYSSIEDSRNTITSMTPKSLAKLYGLIEKHNPAHEPLELTKAYLSTFSDLMPVEILQFCERLEERTTQLKDMMVIRRDEGGWSSIKVS